MEKNKNFRSLHVQLSFIGSICLKIPPQFNGKKTKQSLLYQLDIHREECKHQILPHTIEKRHKIDH